MIRAFSIITVFCIMTVISSAAAANKHKPVKLPSKYLQTHGDVICGFQNGAWLPGKMKGKKFQSHKGAAHLIKQRINSLKESSGSKKQITRLNKQVREFKQLSKQQRSICRTIPIPPGGGKGPVRFNLRGAVGIAQQTASGIYSSQQNTTLSIVTEDGELLPAQIGRNVTINYFTILPNNKVYVFFQGRVNLKTGKQETFVGASGCSLAEVDIVTGKPTCIEDEFAASAINMFPRQGFAFNPAIQIDSEGAIYYIASKDTERTFYSKIRKRLNGRTRTLWSQKGYLNHFKVTKNGTIFFSGGGQFKRLSNQGQMRTVMSNMTNEIHFMHQFPDKKIYFGYWGSGGSMNGVYSLEASTHILDEKAWIANSNGPVHYDCLHSNSRLFFEYQCGRPPYLLFTTSEDEVFGVISRGSDNSQGQLIKYYPTVETPTTIITKIGAATGFQKDLVLAGLDEQQKNRFFLYDTTTGTETDLMPNDDIEIYRLYYVESQNRIMFDGLRFSDNKYVIGWYDINSGQLSATPTGGTKLISFKTFS